MMTRDSKIGRYAAVILFAVFVADLVYGATRGRDPLLTLLGLILCVLAVFALFIDRIRKFNVSAEGLSIEQFERAAYTAANLTASRAKDSPPSDEELHDIATVATRATRSRDAARKRVLWVDDNPQNNDYAMNALRAQNIEVLPCLTTRDALEEFDRRGFDVIVTDLFRMEDGNRREQAGYELIQALRERGVKAPVILSTATPDPDDARRRGFYDATSTQHGAFEIVLRALQGN